MPDPIERNRKAALLEDGLPYFTGSEDLHKHPLCGLLYTSGIRFLAKTAEAWWLLDLVASYQGRSMPADLRPFQLWTLRVDGLRGVAECRRDSYEPAAIRQEIEYADFPLPEIKLYCIDGVLMLPSEY